MTYAQGQIAQQSMYNSSNKLSTLIVASSFNGKSGVADLLPFFERMKSFINSDLKLEVISEGNGLLRQKIFTQTTSVCCILNSCALARFTKDELVHRFEKIAILNLNGRDGYRPVICSSRASEMSVLDTTKTVAIPHRQSVSWRHFSHLFSRRRYPPGYPYEAMWEARVLVCNSHFSALKALLQGQADYACVSSASLDYAYRAGLESGDFRIIQRGPLKSFGAFFVSSSLDERLKNELRSILISYKSKGKESGIISKWRLVSDDS